MSSLADPDRLCPFPHPHESPASSSRLLPRPAPHPVHRRHRPPLGTGRGCGKIRPHLRTLSLQLRFLESAEARVARAPPLQRPRQTRRGRGQPAPLRPAQGALRRHLRLARHERDPRRLFQGSADQHSARSIRADPSRHASAPRRNLVHQHPGRPRLGRRHPRDHREPPRLYRRARSLRDQRDHCPESL